MNQELENNKLLVWSIGTSIGLYLFYVLFNIKLDNKNMTCLISQMIIFFLIMCSILLEDEKMLEYCHCVLWLSFLFVIIVSTSKHIIGFLFILHIFILMSWILNDECILGNHDNSKLNHMKFGSHVVSIISLYIIIYGFYILYIHP